MQNLHHIVIEWGHDLVLRFNQCHLSAPLNQIFSNFQADESSSDNGYMLHIIFINISIYFSDIRYIA